MITSFSVENYSCLADQEIRPGFLNVFLGDPSSGKTHALAAISAMSCSTGETTGTPGVFQCSSRLSFFQSIPHKLQWFLLAYAQNTGALSRNPDFPLSWEMRVEQEGVEMQVRYDSDWNSVVSEDSDMQARLPFQLRPCVSANGVMLNGDYSNDSLTRFAAEKLLNPLEAVTDRIMDFSLTAMTPDRVIHQTSGLTISSAFTSREESRVIQIIKRLGTSGCEEGRGYVFWADPDCTTSKRVQKVVLEYLFEIAKQGTQVFIETSSLFTLREIHILQQKDRDSHTYNGESLVQYFGFHRDEGDYLTRIEQSDDIDCVGRIACLEEELEQSDRYLAATEQ